MHRFDAACAIQDEKHLDLVENSYKKNGFLIGNSRRWKDENRQQVVMWLEKVPQGKTFQELLTRPDSTLRREEQDRIYGESLPTGLISFAASE